MTTKTTYKIDKGRIKKKIKKKGKVKNHRKTVNKIHDINSKSLNQKKREKQLMYIDKMKKYVSEKKAAKKALRKKKYINFLKSSITVGLIVIEVALLLI